MPEKKPLDLKQAQKSGTLDQFIAERESLPEGDMARFDKCLTSMTQTRKPKRGTSPKESCEG